MPQPPPADVTLKTRLDPGDAEHIVALHGEVYAREQGFDARFALYVEEALAAFAASSRDRDRIWIAEREGRIVGCIAIVAATANEAQLRWFLVAPEARGRGLGTHLLEEAVAFGRRRNYDAVHLWTVSALRAAERLYRAAGFERVEERPGRPWGVDVVEERYVLRLRAT